MEQDIRKKLLSLFANEASISLVYLFGSQVTGNIGPMSDYDFGILVTRDADITYLRAHIMYEITLVVGSDHVDLHAPIDLAHAIVAEGVVLYQRDTVTRVEYEAGVMSRYGDYLPVLRSLNADIVRGDRNAKRVQRYRETLRRTERTLGEIRAAQK
jgi:predicted nucleotidyltransferase